MVHSFIDCPRQITFLKKDHKTMIFVLWSQSQWSHHIKEKTKSFHKQQRRRPHFTGTKLNKEVNSTPEKQINSYTFYKLWGWVAMLFSTKHRHLHWMSHTKATEKSLATRHNTFGGNVTTFVEWCYRFLDKQTSRKPTFWSAWHPYKVNDLISSLLERKRKTPVTYFKDH